MKCPKCGQKLRQSKKDPDRLLCDNCRKGFWREDLEDDYEDDYEDDREITKKNKKKQKKKPGVLKIILIVFAVIVIIGVIGSLAGGGETPHEADNTNQSEDQQAGSQSNEQETKTEFAVGETAEYNDVQMTVLSYEESSGNDWGAPADGNVFLFVNIEITNNSDEEISVSSMGSFDNYCDGYALDYSSNALMAASVDNRQQLDGSIASGMKLNGWLGLEVPSNWETVEIHYKDNFFLDSNYKFVIEK